MNLGRLAANKMTVATLVAMIAATPAARAPAQNSDGIRVQVYGLAIDEGRLGCSLFNGPDGFPRDVTRQFRGMYTPIHGDSATCEFNGVPAGTYAVTVLDDTNDDARMDFNALGMPAKGYGFSNNALPTILPPSPPSFDAASFAYSGSGMMTISIDIVRPIF